MIISLIVAMDKNRGIGKNDRLPWHLHSDLQRFKELTMGHHLVMGRKTYQTIGRSLPGRTMIVVTRRKGFLLKDCFVVDSLDGALSLAKKNGETEVFIAGGGDIYKQTLPIADKIYLTSVQADVEADVFFPEIDGSSWDIIYQDETPANEKDEYPSDFKILLRKKLNEG